MLDEVQLPVSIAAAREGLCTLYYTSNWCWTFYKVKHTYYLLLLEVEAAILS